MSYTTNSQVRIAAGIVGNFNISTASIDSKVLMADGVINGKISDVYSLPLEETPAYLIEIASQLAAAFVLIDEYGKETADSDKDGYKRLDLIYNESGTGLLDMIQKKEVKLISDTTSKELAISLVRSPAFRPNNLSESSKDPNVNTSSKIKINKTF